MRSQGLKARSFGVALLLVVCAIPAGVQGQGHSAVKETQGLSGAVPASARWNAWARGQAGGHGGVGLPTRPLAVLSVAQWAAAEGVSAGPEAATALAVGVASADVLTHLYPAHAAQIAQMLEAEHTVARAGGLEKRVLLDAESAGRVAAAKVIARAKHVDSADKAGGSDGSGAGGWTSAAGMEPVGAAWGSIRPWVLTAASAVRPAAPPVPGSREFEAELEQVRQATMLRSEAQLQSAIKWAEASLPAHWNATASQLLAEQGGDDRRAAQVLAVLNTALMDANIACFEAKYAYWYIRPSQADSTISVPVELPNFPAYPSGHACMSGAAAKVLSHYFPSSGAVLNAEAEEVAVSRLYAGVHYPIDNSVGLELGRRVAGLLLNAFERTGIRAALP